MGWLGAGVVGYLYGMVATTRVKSGFPCCAGQVVSVSIRKRFAMTHPANTQINPGFTAACHMSPHPVTLTKTTGNCNFRLSGMHTYGMVYCAVCTLSPENVIFLREKHPRGASIGYMSGLQYFTPT
jgi:hypothetical protein